MRPWLLLALLLAIPSVCGPAWENTYFIPTTDDAAAIINASPAHYRFVFAPGVHSLTASITAKSDQTFEGAGMEATTLTGRQDLTTGTVTWTPDGGDWRTTAVEKAYTTTGETCEAGFVCVDPDDLFFVVDGAVTPKLRVSAVGSVAAGTWFFDEGANTVWVGDDPISNATGSDSPPSIYLSDGDPAIVVNGVDNVTIRNLAVEMFAIGVGNGGAIRVIGGAENALIENTRVSWNHSRGIDCGSAVGLTVRESIASDNGQMGLVGCFLGSGLRVSRSQFNRNNYAGYSNDYASGGIKLGGGTGALIQDSEFAYNKNDAPGLWLDTNEAQTTVERNLVVGNDTWGIKSEVSCNGVIRYNHVEGNGWSGIFCDTCNTTTIERNTVVANSRAITGGRQGGIDVWENDARVGTNFVSGSGVDTCSDSESWAGVANVLVRYNSVVWKPDSPDAAIDPINVAHLSNLEGGDADFVGNCYDLSDAAAPADPFRSAGAQVTFANWQAVTGMDNDADARTVTVAGDCRIRWVAP